MLLQLKQQLTFGVRASELVHKVGDDAVEVDSVIETRIGKIDKVSASNGHLLNVQLRL